MAALNRGVAEARAPYVARMDADDVSLPARLERQVAVLDERPEVGLVGTGFATIDDDGREGRRVVLPQAHDELARRLLLRNVFAHGSVMVRRAAFDGAVGYRSVYGANEDYDLWRRIARSWRLAAVPEILYRYREHETAVTKADVSDREAARERLRDELWRDLDARLFALTSLRADRGDRADLRALAREALRRRRVGLALRLAPFALR